MPCPNLLNPMKPKVIFVCIGNSCRSQMAEGFARSITGGRVEVFSAGSRPAGTVNPAAVSVMKEIGIDISRQHSKGVDSLPREKYDAIVTMGCGDACPHFPAKARIDWKIPDPVGGTHETFVAVREQVRQLVTELLSDKTIFP